MNGLTGSGEKHKIRVESYLSESGDVNGYGDSNTTIKLYIDDKLIDTKTVGSGNHNWRGYGTHNYSQERRKIMANTNREGYGNTSSMLNTGCAK